VRFDPKIIPCTYTHTRTHTHTGTHVYNCSCSLYNCSSSLFLTTLFPSYTLRIQIRRKAKAAGKVSLFRAYIPHATKCSPIVGVANCSSCVALTALTFVEIYIDGEIREQFSLKQFSRASLESGQIESFGLSGGQK